MHIVWPIPHLNVLPTQEYREGHKQDAPSKASGKSTGPKPQKKKQQKRVGSQKNAPSKASGKSTGPKPQQKKQQKRGIAKPKGRVGARK